MTRYALDVGLFAVVVVSAALAGRSARRILLAGWAGAPARLAESIGAVAVLIVVAELLGSVGALGRWTLVGGVVCVAAVARVAVRPASRPADVLEPAPPQGRLRVAIASVAVVAVATRSLHAAADALHGGLFSYDTLWYHAPFAARFAQEGSLTHLHYVANGPTTFYPANGELVHALGMLLFRSDVLSPVVNVAWLGLALLAGWCVGRPYGVAPATMVATALTAFLPVLGGAQAGTAGTDVTVLALLVSAVALVVNGPQSASALVFASLAAGLAAGTKLDAWSAVVALGVAAVVLARGRRIDAALRWVAGVAVGSIFWYARNLVLVGNPLPWLGVLSLPSTSAPADCGRTSVAHYLLDPGFASAHLVPQLSSALGPRWWLVLGLAAVGAGAALCLPRQEARALALVALAVGAAYLVTPATAGGHEARCFGFNTRFATPALALGLILLPVSVARRPFGPLGSLLALAFVLALTVHPSHGLGPLAGAVIAGAVVLIARSAAWRTLPRAAVAGLGLALLLLTAVAGRHVQERYERTRYVGITFSDPVAPVAARLRRVRGARIAVTGLSENYPLYGVDLSNRVDYPTRRDGARFSRYTTCRGWLTALHDGRYDYVVTANEGTAPPREAAWTRRYPGARQELASAPGATNRGVAWTWQLFRLDGTPSFDAAAACA